jgi:hypothetical protein
VGGTERGRVMIVDRRVDPEEIGIGTGIEGHGGRWM